MQNVDYAARIARSIESSIAVKKQLLASTEIISMVADVSQLLIQALRAGNKPIFFGNGGSAADAQHIAAEFVGRFGFNRPALPALALSVNTSCVTAIGNDYGYENVFSRQLEALGRPGDIVFGISTSGNSPNVVRGIQVAEKMGMRTVALTGANGGRLKDEAQYCFRVPSDETPRIQECHMLIGHVVSELVEQAIFSEVGSIS